jgi:hypothetical protein
VGSKQLTVRDALNMALDEELARDERVRCRQISLKQKENKFIWMVTRK